MNKLSLIVRREFTAKVRNKTFLVMTILSPLLIIAMGVLIGYLSKLNHEGVKKVAYLDESGLFSKADFKDNNSLKFINVSQEGFDVARTKVELKEYFGLLHIPKSDSIVDLAKSIHFYSANSPNIMFLSGLERRIDKRLDKRVMELNNIDYDLFESLKVKSNITLDNFSGEETSKLINGLRIGIGMTAGYLIMMFIIIYGASVMRSVIEEKTSRIIEVIISSVKPFQLMIGKIIGNAFAGLLQFSIWAVIIFVVSIVGSYFFGLDSPELTPSSVDAVQVEAMKEVAKSQAQVVFESVLELPLILIFVSFIVYFIGGFLLYSSIYAAIGAAVDNETDTQQFMFPVIVPLMLGVYVGFASVISDPNGPVAIIFSMIPFTSPIVMLMRIPFGVSWWEILLSLLILIATFLLIVWFASKIYRIGILMYGKKPTYKEIYKWLKYS